MVQHLQNTRAIDLHCERSPFSSRREISQRTMLPKRRRSINMSPHSQSCLPSPSLRRNYPGQPLPRHARDRHPPERQRIVSSGLNIGRIQKANFRISPSVSVQMEAPAVVEASLSQVSDAKQAPGAMLSHPACVSSKVGSGYFDESYDIVSWSSQCCSDIIMPCLTRQVQIDIETNPDNNPSDLLLQICDRTCEEEMEYTSILDSAASLSSMPQSIGVFADWTLAFSEAPETSDQDSSMLYDCSLAEHTEGPIQMRNEIQQLNLWLHGTAGMGSQQEDACRMSSSLCSSNDDGSEHSNVAATISTDSSSGSELEATMPSTTLAWEYFDAGHSLSIEPSALTTALGTPEGSLLETSDRYSDESMPREPSSSALYARVPVLPQNRLGFPNSVLDGWSATTANWFPFIGQEPGPLECPCDACGAYNLTSTTKGSRSSSAFQDCQFALGDQSYVPTGSDEETRKQRELRALQDRILIECRSNGEGYGKIMQRLNFTGAESTLRGRYRTLTKAKKDRVRKPVWRLRDVSPSAPLDSTVPLMMIPGSAS
jgi:hypothetical protein